MTIKILKIMALMVLTILLSRTATETLGRTLESIGGIKPSVPYTAPYLPAHDEPNVPSEEPYIPPDIPHDEPHVSDDEP